MDLFFGNRAGPDRRTASRCLSVYCSGRLDHNLHRLRRAPAVTSTRDQTGDWDAPGQTRTVCLSDGSTAKEHLTAYDYPTYFSYTVSDFTGSLRFVTTGANGEWWFAANPAIGGTDVKWRYAFKPRVSLAAPFLSFIAKVLWRGYMRKAIGLCKSEFEAHKPKLSARV